MLLFSESDGENGNFLMRPRKILPKAAQNSLNCFTVIDSRGLFMKMILCSLHFW